jgi:biopolymer transport protein ExbD
MALRTKVEEPEGVNLALFITPMLDMAFQLMAFFLVTFHPIREGSIRGELLPPTEVAGKGAGPADPERQKINAEPKPSDIWAVVLKAMDRNELGKLDPKEVEKLVTEKDKLDWAKRGEAGLPEWYKGRPKEIYIRAPGAPLTDKAWSWEYLSSPAPWPDPNLKPKAGEDPDPKTRAGLEKLTLELEKIKKDLGGVKAHIELEGDSEISYGYIIRVHDLCKTAGFKQVEFRGPSDFRPREKKKG